MFFYEIHVTVNCDNRIDEFKDVCAMLNVKPIIIDAQKRSGDVLTDVMTSSIIRTADVTVEEAQAEMLRISNAMILNGFKVSRGKIEVSSNHPDCPTIENEKDFGEGCHYEVHFPIICKEDDVSVLKKFAEANDLHLSRSFFKIWGDGRFIQMMTFRSYDLRLEKFKDKVDEIVTDLYDHGYHCCDIPKIEYAIYDSNFSHDYEWIRG